MVLFMVMKNSLRIAYFTVVTLVLMTPSFVFGQGLVPQCSRGEGSEPCQFCHVVELINNVVAWLVGVLGIIAALIIMYAGFLMVASGGNASAKEKAKGFIVNIVIGYVLVLGAWILIDTGFRALIGGQSYGMWNQIQCTDQPRATEALNRRIITLENTFPTPGQSRGTAYAPGGASGMSDAELQAYARQAASLSADEADALIAAAATNPDQVRYMQALMRVESGGCRNNISPAGALGCMQIMPNTARGYDPSLRNLTDAQVRQRLLDPAYNIQLGVRIYEDLNTRYDGDLQRTFAAYNGGPGANDPSRDCPGLMRWQCEWDNPQQTIPNTGYVETRNYVQRVEATANNL